MAKDILNDKIYGNLVKCQFPNCTRMGQYGKYHSSTHGRPIPYQTKDLLCGVHRRLKKLFPKMYNEITTKGLYN